MEFVTVVEVIDGVASQVVLFQGEHSAIKEKAEDLFLNICRENIWSFDTYSQTDIDNILADGWEKWGDNSVSIVWPDVK